MDFATRIRTARRRAGLSQQKLARLLNVSRGAVANWESAVASSPSTSNLQRLALITGVAIEWLATGQGAMASAELFNAAMSSGVASICEMESNLLAIFRVASESDKALIVQMVQLLLQHR